MGDNTALGSIKSPFASASAAFQATPTKCNGPHLYEQFSATSAEGPLGPIRTNIGTNIRTSSVPRGRITNRRITDQKFDTTFGDGKPLDMATPVRNVVRRGACRSRGPCQISVGEATNH